MFLNVFMHLATIIQKKGRTPCFSLFDSNFTVISNVVLSIVDNKKNITSCI
eukprot:UN00618